MQFYSLHAACSHELFSELWIDAGGEKARETNVSVKVLSSYVGNQLQRETAKKLLQQH